MVDTFFESLHLQRCLCFDTWVIAWVGQNFRVNIFSQNFEDVVLISSWFQYYWWSLMLMWFFFCRSAIFYSPEAVRMPSLFLSFWNFRKMDLDVNSFFPFILLGTWWIPLWIFSLSEKFYFTNSLIISSLTFSLFSFWKTY